MKLTALSDQEFRLDLKTEETSLERELVVTSDLVQVREPDGSLRRLAFTAGANQPSEANFFYRGRPRSVLSVGGVGGRVEGAQSEGSVSAPMNGQVVKITAQPGDIMECGDIVLILEAMKMENTLRAEKKAKVSAIKAGAGDNLAVDEVIMEFEAV